MGDFKLTYEKKLSTEWNGKRYILLQEQVFRQNQGVLLN
jgi:hypothetical protein